MPRIRTIKPEFFTSLTIADLSYEARLTFIGLWTHVDDQGRCVDDARLVKAAVWPLDERTSKDVDVDLWELADAELVQRYTVGRKKFLAVRSWEEHQKINRPSSEKLPPPEEGEPTPKARELMEGSLKAHGGLTEGSHEAHSDPGKASQSPHLAPEMPESVDGVEDPGKTHPEAVVLPFVASENTTTEGTHGGLTEHSLSTHDRKGKEQGTGKGKETTSPRSARKHEDDDLEADFTEWYGGYPNKQDRGAARKAYAKARKKATAQQLLDGLERYKTLDPHHARGFTKYPATWLNKECWLNEYDSGQLPRASGDGHHPFRNPDNPADAYDPKKW